MDPVVFMAYTCFLLRYTRRFYLAEEFDIFWSNPEKWVSKIWFRGLVQQIKTEMRYECRRKRWFEGEQAWDKFSADDLIAFLLKYDIRRRNAKRKTKKNKSDKKGHNSNKGGQTKRTKLI